MAYNQDFPANSDYLVTAPTEIRENFRALKEDKIVAADSANTADSAVKLANARTISLTGDAAGSAAFDGSADISIIVDVTSADSAATCTGNAATATKLETAHTINDVAFDGTADITITQVNGKTIATTDEIPTSLPANGGDADTVGGLDVNDIITKSSLSAIPIGCITMWSGSIAAIPTNWHLCDGTNGTPNLLDRMVVCAGNSYAAGVTGGEATHTLTIAEMPSHCHYMNGWTNDATGGPAAPGAGPFEGGYNTNYTGGGQPHNNMPPYYALAYIMRII
jgi:hypothetical protein